MASPTRRIYVTDREATALAVIVEAVEAALFDCIEVSREDIVAAKQVLAKLDLAGRAQPNRT